MKSILKFIYLSLFIIALVSCEKENDTNVNDIAGIYQGTLSADVASKTTAKSTSTTGDPATAEITLVGDQIQVHCYNDDFDITLMLDLFSDEENIQVCLTGDDFEEMYGHMSTYGGGMMGGMTGNSNQWSQHLNDDHESGDQHFGGFDMGNHSFEYTFNVEGMEYYFEGFKQ
ncbi:MAG: hypothetical protein COC16_03390 [Lutibacter sp.]|nr:MAG: hypothetical protein COC16_03390 [Lutibacter sp.]